MSKFGTASDMMAFTWSEELAYGAQLWANQCQFFHDTAMTCQYNRLGQNLYMAWTSDDDAKPDWKAAISSWYDEVRIWTFPSMQHKLSGLYPFQVHDFYGPINSYQWHPPTGHFSQVIWSETHEIGCGYISFLDRFQKSLYYVCNYGPAGNIIGQSIYIPGKACENCPEGTSCDNGLCSKKGTDANNETGAESTSEKPSSEQTEAPSGTATMSPLLPYCEDICRL